MFDIIDIINLIVSILGFIATIYIFIRTSRDTRRATEEQTRRECIRATLTEFASLRRAYQQLENELTADNREAKLKSYLSDMERFAVGCTHKAYDVDIVNDMSGGMLINQYQKYFREFITERRRVVRLDGKVTPWNIYSDYERMMKQIYMLRDEKWEEPILQSEEEVVLDRFLHMRISSPDEVFSVFNGLDGAREGHGSGKERYMYIPGTRSDRCVLVAHADTYFDAVYQNIEYVAEVVLNDGIYCSRTANCSIGADDRAGCAMLWLLRNSGHSLLILDGEEHGQVGARYLREKAPRLFEELNNHTFMIELDRRGSCNYKCYDLPVTDEFVRFIEDKTGYKYVDGKGKTDIGVLCEKICGVNLSVGYYDEHKSTEKLCYDEWINTYNIVKRILEEPLKRFELK